MVRSLATWGSRGPEGGVCATSFSGDWPLWPEKDGFFNMPVAGCQRWKPSQNGGQMRTFRSDIGVKRFVDGRRVLYFHRHLVVCACDGQVVSAD